MSGLKRLRLIGVVLAGPMVLSLGGCALQPDLPTHRRPRLFSLNGREDLEKGASLIAAATGGKADTVNTGECEDGAWGAVVVDYSDELKIGDLLQLA